MSAWLYRVIGAGLMLLSFYFIGDEIVFRGYYWGIPASGSVICMGLGIWGFFSNWPRSTSAILLGAGVGLILINSRVWMNPISLRDLLIAMALLLGGCKLITTQSN